MAKKRAKNIQQMLAKKQQLQQLQTGSSVPDLPPAVKATPQLPAKEEQPALPSADNKPVTRTVVSVAIIAVLLVGAAIVGRQTEYFRTFGDWLYQALRLG